MGYDLYGVKAESEVGAYFRNNVWWWRPLAEYVVATCAVAQPEEWFYNGGHMVSGDEAKAIAVRLRKLLAAGAVKDYAQRYAARLTCMPDEECDLCRATGVRNDEIVRGTCNGCGGTGRVRPFRTNYPFSEENVREFAQFCEESGGFTIC